MVVLRVLSSNSSYILQTLVGKYLTCPKSQSMAVFTLHWIDQPRAPKVLSSGTIFVTIMTGNAPILKVVRSVSDSFLERSAPNVNVLFSGSVLFFGTESLYHSLGLEARFLLPNQNKYGAYRSGTCEQLNSGPVQSASISLSIVHIASDRFLNRIENRSCIV